MICLALLASLDVQANDGLDINYPDLWAAAQSARLNPDVLLTTLSFLPSQSLLCMRSLSHAFRSIITDAKRGQMQCFMPPTYWHKNFSPSVRQYEIFLQHPSEIMTIDTVNLFKKRQLLQAIMCRKKYFIIRLYNRENYPLYFFLSHFREAIHDTIRFLLKNQKIIQLTIQEPVVLWSNIPCKHPFWTAFIDNTSLKELHITLLSMNARQDLISFLFYLTCLVRNNCIEKLSLWIFLYNDEIIKQHFSDLLRAVQESTSIKTFKHSAYPYTP